MLNATKSFNFLFATFVLLFALLVMTPRCAKAGEPDMNKVCNVMAEMTAKTCYAVASEHVRGADAQTFVVQMCVATGDWAKATCLDEKTRARYAEKPTCVGLTMFTYDAIVAGGSKAVSQLPGTKEERERLMHHVDMWAAEASTQLFNGCRDYEARQQKKPAPKHQEEPLSI